MRLKLISAFALAAILATGCGKEEKKHQPQAAEKSLEEAKKIAAANKSEIPEATIMMVPLDKDGNEITDAAVMRKVNADISGKESADLLELFKSGSDIPKAQIAESVNDDMDESSTASWFGWFKHKGKKSCGRYNYCDYRPTCGYAGYTYQYTQVYQGTYCGANVAACGPVPSYRTGYLDYQGFQGGYAGYPQYGFEGLGSPGYQSPFIGYDNAYRMYGWQRSF
jgi:hypothetical protein